MEIANSMKGITEDIITSYNIRTRAFADLVSDTQKTLEGFASERKERGKEQAERLSNFVEGLSKGTRDMMKGFRKDRKQMSEKQTKVLTGFIKNLSGDVGNMLQGFQKARGKMSKDLKGILAREVKDIKTSVGNIVSGTRKLLGEYNSDIKMAAHAWQDMCKTLSAARKNSAVVSVEGTKKEEAVFHEAETEEKILNLVRRHPEGLKVGDMEGHLGIVRTKLGAIAKRLLEGEKIRKEENLYFPL